MNTKIETLFVAACVNWATNRNWQTKLLDTRKVTLLNLLRQESVKQASKKKKKKKKPKKQTNKNKQTNKRANKQPPNLPNHPPTPPPPPQKKNPLSAGTLYYLSLVREWVWWNRRISSSSASLINISGVYHFVWDFCLCDLFFFFLIQPLR